MPRSATRTSCSSTGTRRSIPTRVCCGVTTSTRSRSAASCTPRSCAPSCSGRCASARRCTGRRRGDIRCPASCSTPATPPCTRVCDRRPDHHPSTPRPTGHALMPEESAAKRLGYEQARDQLAELVKRLEAGGLTLEQSLELWERGERLAAICAEWLEGARARLATAMAQRGGGPADPAAPF